MKTATASPLLLQPIPNTTHHQDAAQPCAMGFDSPIDDILVYSNEIAFRVSALMAWYTNDTQLARYVEEKTVGWIVPDISSWGAYTNFPLKSNGDLRVVMDYRPINGVTIKLQWPMHNSTYSPASGPSPGANWSRGWQTRKNFNSTAPVLDSLVWASLRSPNISL